MVPVPKKELNTLQESEAGTYICRPEFSPQIKGGACPPGTDTEKKSVSHVPILVKSTPKVMAVDVIGFDKVKVSKSNLSWQTSDPCLHIVRVQLEPADLEALVKYVQFSDMVPSPQLFSKTQHTPKLEAQDPEEDPPLEAHSDCV